MHACMQARAEALGRQLDEYVELHDAAERRNAALQGALFTANAQPLPDGHALPPLPAAPPLAYPSNRTPQPPAAPPHPSAACHTPVQHAGYAGYRLPATSRCPPSLPPSPPSSRPPLHVPFTDRGEPLHSPHDPLMAAASHPHHPPVDHPHPHATDMLPLPNAEAVLTAVEEGVEAGPTTAPEPAAALAAAVTATTTATSRPDLSSSLQPKAIEPGSSLQGAGSSLQADVQLAQAGALPPPASPSLHASFPRSMFASSPFATSCAQACLAQLASEGVKPVLTTTPPP